jgi:hypothetical protein
MHEVIDFGFSLFGDIHHHLAGVHDALGAHAVGAADVQPPETSAQMNCPHHDFHIIDDYFLENKVIEQCIHCMLIIVVMRA